MRVWSMLLATALGLATAFVSMTLVSEPAGAAPQQVGDEIWFCDDFELRTMKWLDFAYPPTNQFAGIPGVPETANVRQCWFLGPVNVLSMVSREMPWGFAYGLSGGGSSLLPQDRPYIALSNFSVRDIVNPGDPVLPGAFTVYDDGFVRLRIEGTGPSAE